MEAEQRNPLTLWEDLDSVTRTVTTHLPCELSTGARRRSPRKQAFQMAGLSRDTEPVGHTEIHGRGGLFRNWLTVVEAGKPQDLPSINQRTRKPVVSLSLSPKVQELEQEKTEVPGQEHSHHSLLFCSIQTLQELDAAYPPCGGQSA